MKSDLYAALTDFRDKFQASLEDFVRTQSEHSPVHTRDARKLTRNVSKLALGPGKRMRPFLAMETARTYGITFKKAEPLGLALELFHDFALVHDDIMDRSEERRGKPTLHKIYEDEHRKKDWKGSSTHYGASSAILGGDLLYTWAERAFDACHADPDVKKKLCSLWSEMKEEVILGQTLDVTVTVLNSRISRKQLLDVLALKSGRYSIGRPILLGYALAEVDVHERTVLDATEPLGLAFQIQDDILGTFGDPKKTGKSTDSDLKEGKLTLLAWEVQRRIVDSEDQKRWDATFGNPKATKKELDALRKIVKQSGALELVETLAQQLIDRAIENAYALPRISDWFIELAKTLEKREK